MGITPITSFIPVNIASPIRTELEPLPMERAESSSRSGDESYSPSGDRSASGSEEDAATGESVEDAAEEMVDSEGSENSASSTGSTALGGVSFFA
jgi:hypothetical protein